MTSILIPDTPAGYEREDGHRAGLLTAATVPCTPDDILGERAKLRSRHFSVSLATSRGSGV